MSLKFHFCGLSDVGVVRPNNEDVWIANPEMGFFALADGMGGHLAGEIAAQEATAHLLKTFKNHLHLNSTSNPRTLAEILHRSIESANDWVYRMGKQFEECTGMGTTLCCLYWTKEAVIYAHVGDSRIYRFRDQKLELLTKDHSLLAKWMAMGKRAEECKTPYPYKNVITKAIGTHPKSNPEIALSDYEPSDLFLLCTDGLSDVLSTEDMEKILCKREDLSLAANALIELSKNKGSYDNITVLIVQQVSCKEST